MAQLRSGTSIRLCNRGNFYSLLCRASQFYFVENQNFRCNFGPKKHIKVGPIAPNLPAFLAPGLRSCLGAIKEQVALGFLIFFSGLNAEQASIFLVLEHRQSGKAGTQKTRPPTPHHFENLENRI